MVGRYMMPSRVYISLSVRLSQVWSSAYLISVPSTSLLRQHLFHVSETTLYILMKLLHIILHQ